VSRRQNGCADSLTGKTLATAAIGNSPEAAGYDPNHKLAFSSNGGDATLSIVDSSNSSYTTVQTLKTAKGARTKALDPTNGTIDLTSVQYGALLQRLRPRPAILPGSFTILVVSR
jgi:hypothetical protein